MSDDPRDGPWTITCGVCPWRAEFPTDRGAVKAYRRHMRRWHTRQVLASHLRRARSLLGLRNYLE